MPQELAKARRTLSKVVSDLKQGQGISAATAIRDAARMVGRVALLKKEQDEFVSLLQTATEYMKYDKKISRIFPLSISYTPGQEESLADLMNQIIESLQETNLEEAREKHEEYQGAQLLKAQKYLQAGKLEEGRKILVQLQEEYSEDVELVTEIGEIFARAGLYEDAARHLGLAARLTPDSAHVLNRLGIVLRRLERFEEAERIYSRAVALEQTDPNLYFNMGRLYLDMGQWSQVRAAVTKALELEPDFAEAVKMLAYAERKMAEKTPDGSGGN